MVCVQIVPCMLFLCRNPLLWGCVSCVSGALFLGVASEFAVLSGCRVLMEDVAVVEHLKGTGRLPHAV